MGIWDNIKSALHGNDINEEGHGTAVSLPQLIVGKRHCRVLIMGNVNVDATGNFLTFKPTRV